jgi:FliI/YscN family ATPase
MTSTQTSPIGSLLQHTPEIELLPWVGEVTEMVGLLIASRGPVVSIGDFCEVRTSSGRTIRSQVIGFRNEQVLSLPLEEMDGLQLGDRVIARKNEALLRVGPQLLGRVLDGFGRPIDGGPPIQASAAYPLYAAAPCPLEREHITEPLVTGIRAIDGLLPCGKGQRVGIFGGSGVGKSTLLGAMSRHNDADVSVIALVGESNREVRAFLENELGPQGRSRSVVVVATSDRPAPLRIRSCFVALAVAEYFRDQGKNVLMVLDSVTRLAMAQREIGLAAGEPPSQKGTRRPFLPCCLKSSNARDTSRKAPSRDCSPFWWKGTILTSRFVTRCAVFWTATLSCRASWDRPAIIQPWISGIP